MEIFAEASRQPEIRAAEEANDRRLRLGITKAVRDGQKRGLIGGAQSPSSMADTVMALYEGFIGRLGSGHGLRPRAAAKMTRFAVSKLLAPAP